MTKPKVPSNAEKIPGLVYARTRTRALELDLYLPRNAAGPLPLIVWVHGGAFRAGTRADCGEALPLLASGDFAIASVDYRLSQEAPFPAQIRDVKAAVRWLRAHAARYNLDPNRFGAWGSSAGGHLVAMLGLTPYMLAWNTSDEYIKQADPSAYTTVQAVCDWYGPTDFLRMNDAPGGMDHDAPDSPESELVGAPIQQRPDLVAAANPLTYVYASTPPFLICHGDRDPLVLHDQSVRLQNAAQGLANPVEMITIRGAGHGFHGKNYRSLLEKVHAFFTRHLIEKHGPPNAQYVCTPASFHPAVSRPVRWLDPATDYPIARAYWEVRVPLTEAMWLEAYQDYHYRYAAVIENGKICSLAAAWQRFDRAWELAAVSTNDLGLRRQGYSKSVCSFITQYILDSGRLATVCATHDNLPMQRTAESLGYIRVG